MGYWKSKVVPMMKRIFEKSPAKKPDVVEEKPREEDVVIKTEEPVKADETKPEEIVTGDKEKEIVEEKKEEVKPVEEKKEEVKSVEIPVVAAAEENKPVVEEEKKPVVEEEKKPAVEEEKKSAVEEEKKTAVEDEKKPVEEEKKEVVAAVPVAEAPSTKAPEIPEVLKAPEIPEPKPNGLNFLHGTFF